jgi:putative transcriptional regulator
VAFEMTTLGKRLIQAAEEARAIARGEADPSTYRVHVPADLDVKAIRQGLNLTQAEFSARYGFPLGTLRDWEQGKGKPDTSARAYLLVIKNDPQAVERALHAALINPAPVDANIALSSNVTIPGHVIAVTTRDFSHSIRIH